MRNVNPAGVIFAIMVPIAGYCFGGQIGLGIAACVVALVNMVR